MYIVIITTTKAPIFYHSCLIDIYNGLVQEGGYAKPGGRERSIMIRNTLNPDIEVDLASAQVLVDNKVATSEAVKELPLNQLYILH